MRRLPFTPQGFAFILVALLAGLHLCFAQTTFERTFGGLWGSSVQQTLDGGYIIAGYSSFDNYGGGGLVCLVKTNSSGDTLWTKMIGYGSNDPFVQQTSDGGYIITGTGPVHIQVGARSAYLVKVDSGGGVLWTRWYMFQPRMPDFTSAYAVQQTPDGGYIIAGDSRGCIRLLKTNDAGDTLWTKGYGGYYDEAHSVQQTSDGGYIVTGYTNYPSFYKNFYLLKTNDSGDTLWTRTYGHGSGNSVQQTSDGGYIAAGYISLSGDPSTERGYLLKTNASGDTLWTRTFDKERAYSVQQSSDEGYVIAGGSVLMKTDPSGDTIWTRTYNGSVRSARQTSDGGYISAGTSSSSYGDAPGIYLVKTRPDGLLDAPDSPTLSQPYDGAIGISTSPALGWLWCPRAQCYTLQVALDSLFTELIVDDSTIHSTTKVISGLSYDTQYYWRVSAMNQAGKSEYSDIWTFTTASAGPTLVSPPNGATNQSTTLTLIWNPSPGASHYRLQLGTDSTFLRELLLDDSTLVDTLRAVSGLGPCECYFWRVRGGSAGGNTDFSKPYSFRTLFKAPDPPEIISPADSATGIALNPVCTWHRPASASSFHLQLGPDSTFVAGLRINDTTLVDTLKKTPLLDNSTRYYLRIRAKNLCGYSVWSSIHQFTTMDPDPAIPRLLAPPHRATELDTPVTASWTRPSGATAFHLQVCGDSTFAAALALPQLETPDTFAVIRNLPVLDSYWWRVHAFQPVTGTSDFSPPRKFSIRPLTPARVILAGPPSDTVITTDTLRIRWRRLDPTVDKFWVQFGTDSTFSTCINHPAILDTTDVLRALEINTHYYWRVKAHNASGWGMNSVQRHFVRIVTGVAEVAPGAPFATALLQNYPNPFNPSTTIKYELPKASEVKLSVHDMLGREVSVLVDERRDAGVHEVKFEGEGLSSGVYFYRLRAGDFVSAKKMLVLK